MTLRQKRTIVRRFMQGTESVSGIAFELVTRTRPWNKDADSDHGISDILRDYMNGKFSLTYHPRTWRSVVIGDPK